MPASPSIPIRLSRRGALALGVAGLLIAALAALVPVSVHFADDPLLNLRRLDPQLTSSSATADCGSPVRSLSVDTDSPDLYDLARTTACHDAAQRRIAAGLAAAAICIALAFFGLVNGRLADEE